jgi:dihydroorotase
LKKLGFINGKLLSCIRKTLDSTNLLIANGRIAGLGYLPDEDSDAELYDASNCIIVPGIIDCFANLRYPGNDLNETIKSASLAAGKAGITGIIASPKTSPYIDNPEMLSYLFGKCQADSEIPIYPLGTITKEAGGKELAEIGLMLQNGALGFTDAQPIENISLMENALKYSKMFDCPLIISPISHQGLVNEGYYSTILGLPGNLALLEEIKIARDIRLLEEFGGHIHFSPVSTAGAIECIRAAKKKGLKVTCGTAPHYFYLTDQATENYNTNVKVNPPFRSKKDIKALIEAVKDGTLDIISSHHMPCSVDEKRTDFHSAKFGISGLDLFLPLIINKLYHEEKIALFDIFKLITVNPRNVFNLPPAKLSLNNPATFTIIDLNKEMKIKAENILSAGKNTPFIGTTLKGFSTATVANGKLINNILPSGLPDFNPGTNN